MSLLFILTHCASYQYTIKTYKNPVSFSDERSPSTKTRFFQIEKKISWLFLDIWNVEPFDLTETLEKGLPKARRIHNLRISSEEGWIDSLIRFVSTGTIVFSLISNKPILFSRRTIIITGDVEED